jgi:hypothetical protein
MTLKPHLLLLTFSLLAAPAGVAFAQAGNAGATGTVSGQQGAASNPRQPGATGETIVKGDSSTIHGDRKATKEQKTETLSK